MDDELRQQAIENLRLREQAIANLTAMNIPQSQDSNQPIGARESENIPQTMVRALLETPKTVASIPSGLLSIAKDTGNAVVNPIDSIQDGTTERALRATGGISGAVAGAGLGLKAGAGLGTMVLPGIGTAVGGGIGTLVGGGLGALGFRKLLQVTGSDEPTSLKKDMNDLVYDSTQGLAMAGTGKVLQGTGRALKGSGRLLRAKKAIQELAEEADSLPSNIVAPDDELAKLTTASEITGDKGLMRAETNIKRLVPEFNDTSDIAREVERANIARKGLKVTGFDDQVRGELIRKGVKDVKKQRGSVASSLYDDVSQVKDIDLQNTTFANDILEVMDELDNTPSNAPSAIKRAGAISEDVAQFQEELFDLASSGEPVSLSDLNALQSEASSMAFRLKNEGGKSYAVANKLSSTLRDTMDNLPDGSTAKVARSTWRSYKKSFDEMFGKDATGTTKFGTETTEASKLPKKALSSPEKIDNFMEIAKDSPIARTALTDHINEQFVSRLEGITSPQGSARITNWWKANKGQYSKILSPKDVSFMERVVGDVQRARAKFEAARAGSRGISPTAALQNYDKYLRSVVGGTTAEFLKKNNGLAKKLAFMGGGALGYNQGLTNMFVLGSLGAKGIEVLGNSLSKVAKGRQKLILDALQDPKVYNEVMSTPDLANILPEGSAVGASQLGQFTIEENAKNEQENITQDNNDYKGLLNVPRESGAKGQSQKKADSGPITEDVLDAVRWVESRDGKFLESPAGAKGPYQFMPATAKAYNVDPTDDNWEDDREGARNLLSDEYKALGSIELALASYNLGRPRLLRAIKKAGTKDWNTVSKLLPKETREYVPKIKKRLKEQETSFA